MRNSQLLRKASRGSRHPIVQILPERLEIPSELHNYATKYQLPEHEWWSGRREMAGVDDEFYKGCYLLSSDGFCDWHDDKHVDPECWRYSCLLILRNDTNSWIQGFNSRKYVNQPPGTTLILDAWRTHSLRVDGGEKGARGVWLAACVNFPPSSYPDTNDCIARMLDKINFNK